MTKFGIVRQLTVFIFIAILLAGCESESSGGGSGSYNGAGSSGSATLSWLPPTQRTDNSPLTNLAGYKIYVGTTSGDYTEVITIDNPGISEYVIENLSSGETYYFVMTSVDTNNIESAFSSEGSKTI